MESEAAEPRGFGTTPAEWELLALAYRMAVAVADHGFVPEETRAQFKRLDDKQNLMFEDWWKTRRSL